MRVGSSPTLQIHLRCLSRPHLHSTMSGISHSSLSSYQTSGFATKMGWGKRPALLIIDVCQAYFVPPSQSPLSLLDNTAAVTVPDSIRSLLSAAREGGVPVIHTNVVYNSPTMADAGLFWLKAKVLDVWQVGDERGLEGWVEGIKPNDGEHVITKTYASGFFGTALATTLQVLGVDTVVICGVSTSGCVRVS